MGLQQPEGTGGARARRGSGGPWAWLAALGLLAPGAAPAAGIVTVYDDQLRSGFLDYSYGGGSDFAATAVVHEGTQAIAFGGSDFNAVSFAHETQDFAPGGTLQLYVHGGATGGQQLRLYLQRDGVITAQAELDAYIVGGAIAAGEWRLVEVPLDTAPFAAGGFFDRIDLQSDVAGAQATLYIDSVALVDEGLAVPLVFRDGFEPVEVPPAANGLSVQQDVAIDGLLGDRIGWRDAAGQPREAVLARNDGAVGAGGSRGGELRELRYQAGGATRIVRAPPSGAGGFGYVVSHPGDGMACTGQGDSSSLGHFTGGQFTRVWQGRHHAIWRFTQDYPRYCSTTVPASNSVVPVTIEWLFASGRDHPLWAVSYDLSAIPVNTLNDDARAPYGELLFDGAASAGAHSAIAGVAWGDAYVFTTTSTPVTYDSSWSWNTPNTVPFVKLWTTSVDATMGTVQTQTKAQQDAGGYFGADRWNSTSAAGDACAGSGFTMPCDFNWPFQSINYSLDQVPPVLDPTNNTRLAWGTNFGFLGQATYPVHGSDFYGGPLAGDPRAPGWPRKSYGVHVVLGRHSDAPVEAQVAEVEAVQTLVLGASVGSVATSGIAGVGRSDVVAYAPAGYDHVRGALTFVAAGNALTATIDVGAGALTAPLIVLRNWNGDGLPAAVRLDGELLALDVDWLPSPRPEAGELWITLARPLDGNHTLQVQ